MSERLTTEQIEVIRASHNSPRIRAMATELLALREALGDIARQKLTAEIGDDEDEGGGDWDFAYDAMIKVARAALAPQENTDGK